MMFDRLLLFLSIPLFVFAHAQEILPPIQGHGPAIECPLPAAPAASAASTSGTSATTSAPPATVKSPLEADPDIAVAFRMERAYGKVAEALYPAVVCVTTYRPTAAPATNATGAAATNTPETAKQAAWRNTGKSSPYPGFEPDKTGSGFFIDREGHLLTCRHSILGATGTPARVIDVETDDGRKTLCRVVGTEPTLNLALLKLEVMPQNKLPEFSVPRFHWVAEDIFPGQIALSVGDPAGAVRTFSAGLFSATPNRQCYQNDLTSTYLQACLTAHPEAYGGPVVNIKGEVVGMLTPRVTPTLEILPNPGIEFVMPIQILATIADALKVNNSNQSPWLGFSVLDLAARYKQLIKEDPVAVRPPKPGEKRRMPYTGVYIDDLHDPGPGATAGVQVGDYLVSINGHKLFSVFNFQERLYLEGIGAQVELELFRNGDTRKIALKIEERPADAITH